MTRPRRRRAYRAKLRLCPVCEQHVLVLCGRLAGHPQRLQPLLVCAGSGEAVRDPEAEGPSEVSR